MYGADVGRWLSAGTPVLEGTVLTHVGGLPEAIVSHESHLGHEAHRLALIVSSIVAFGGLIAAWFLYVRRRDLPAKFCAKFPTLYAAVRGKYFIDEAVDYAVLKPTVRLAGFLRKVDENVVDGAVLLIGRVHKALGSLAAWVDSTFVDGLVNAVGLVSQNLGAALRLFQTGRIQQYAAFAVGGGILAAAWLILS